MPAKRIKKVTTVRPAFVLYGVLYDPGGRAGNIRLIIEGPFGTHEDAVAALQTLRKNMRFSVADYHVSMISSAELFRTTIDRIRVLIQ